MASYLILGAGKFGRLALRRLARQDAAASFVVVDRDPAALAEALDGVPGWTRVQAEAIAFLVQQLGGDGRWDWIIPMVPVHVAFHWLLAGPLAGSGWQPQAVPEALAGLIPGARRGPQGELYLSRARHLCPDDCAEPEVCPVTGESRDLPLHQELASLHLAGYEIRVIPSRQLAPGVGGYPPGRLLDLARDMGALTGNVLIATACRCHGVIHGLAQGPGERVFDFSGVLGTSPRIREIFQLLEMVAPSEATVLLLGETGTGKELVAQAIHRNSPRAAGPFVVVNCATLPETLLESELFGHERGSFTGATVRKEGRFLVAHHGTVFLDEIGELTLPIQAKILRVLQAREFEPVGSNRTQKVDVRIITATNRDLEKMVREGRFRDDLYYRLNVFPLVLPPLRERLEDLPVLADFFLKKYGEEEPAGGHYPGAGGAPGLPATTPGRETSGNWKTSSNAG